MADDYGDQRNKLAGPKEPSMMERAQTYARDWWNGLGQDMRSQAEMPQSELLRRFGVSALTLGPMGLGPRGGGRDAGVARMLERQYPLPEPRIVRGMRSANDPLIDGLSPGYAPRLAND